MHHVAWIRSLVAGRWDMLAADALGAPGYTLLGVIAFISICGLILARRRLSHPRDGEAMTAQAQPAAWMTASIAFADGEQPSLESDWTLF
jgi:hypothetical protein